MLEIVNFIYSWVFSTVRKPTKIFDSLPFAHVITHTNNNLLVAFITEHYLSV